jgi:GNAT superfamily N-acetyltransferase
MANRSQQVSVEVLDPKRLDDFNGLFGGDAEANGCWCMWHIIRVADYHAGGGTANRKRFHALMESSKEPMGLLAYADGETVGWCAAGPRARYARAVKTPTMKGRDPDEDETVWFVPCFFVRRDARKLGVTRELLTGAVALAKKHKARAIEGFPTAEGAKRSRDSMAGHESVFASCGFEVIRRPSPARVVMRREISR